MAFMIGAAHVLQWRVQRDAKSRDQANPKKNAPQFGLQAETRLHEAGIASNRGSAYRGEYVPEPCTHRPSSHESGGPPKSLSELARDAGAEAELRDWD